MREDSLKFNKGKSMVLHLGKSNPMSQHRLGPNILESSSAEKSWWSHCLGGPVDNRLSLSQQGPCGQEAQWYLGYIRKSIAVLV